jgi:serine/threonine protein phosphatase 1
MRNGGGDTLDSYENFLISPDHMVFLTNLPLCVHIDIDTMDKPVLITHSCITSNLNDEIDDIKKGYTSGTFLWSRDIGQLTNSGYFNVFGHTPLKEPLVLNDFACIDGGCTYGYELWALDLLTLSVIRQPFVK